VDQWLELSFKPIDASDNAIKCSVNDHNVCHYKSRNAESASSCAFLLPAGGSLVCEALAGSVTVLSATARDLARNLGPTLTPESKTCPPASTDGTLCDCSYTNSANHDMLISMGASNVDDVFNSFHCYVGGANVCAWGVNNGEKGWAGQCNFILPAGAEYWCQMQWGATAFPEVSALPLSGNSIFAASTQESAQLTVVVGTKHVMTGRAQSDVRRLFEEYQQVHGEVSVERFENFKRYIAMVDNHPTNGFLSHGSQLSPLAVLSREEFESTYRGCAKVDHVTNGSSGLTQEDLDSTPKEIDWRSKGAVTPVKDQGQCGSCWAFSTSGVLEGAWAAAGHGLESLSEQHLVSCDNNDGNAGCGGGWPYKAIDYVAQNGIDTEESYPYNSGSGTAPACAASSGTRAGIQVVKHATVESDEEVMAAWVAKNGPLSISIDAMTSIWWSYTGGIVSGCCNTQVDHAVLIVGFGEEDGQKYWLIKNSWSETWGESGYIRLERGSNQCGITYAPVGAIVSGEPTPPSPSPVPPSPSPLPPSPVPSPTPSSCPQDAQQVTVGGQVECLWTSGSGGLTIPSTAREYCGYVSQGYLGYTWDSSAGDYSCSPSARKSASGSTNFCVWEDGSLGVSIPSGSTADCDSLSEGRIGWRLPSASVWI